MNIEERRFLNAHEIKDLQCTMLCGTGSIASPPGKASPKEMLDGCISRGFKNSLRAKEQFTGEVSSNFISKIVSTLLNPPPPALELVLSLASRNTRRTLDSLHRGLLRESRRGWGFRSWSSGGESPRAFQASV